MMKQHQVIGALAVFRSQSGEEVRLSTFFSFFFFFFWLIVFSGLLFDFYVADLVEELVFHRLFSSV